MIREYTFHRDEREDTINENKTTIYTINHHKVKSGVLTMLFYKLLQDENYYLDYTNKESTEWHDGYKTSSITHKFRIKTKGVTND